MMQERVCREVICFKGQVTERTRKWVFFILRVFWFCSHPSSPIPSDELYIHTKY